MAPFQLGCVGVGSKNGFSNGSLLGLMGTPKLLLRCQQQNQLQYHADVDPEALIVISAEVGIIASQDADKMAYS